MDTIKSVTRIMAMILFKQKKKSENISKQGQPNERTHKITNILFSRDKDF